MNIIWTNGLISRLIKEDGSIVQFFYYPNDNLKNIYHYNNKHHQHNENGPAFLEYDSATGRIEYESYHINGELHRLDGPAIFEKFQTVDDELLYYIDNKNYTEDEFLLKRLNDLLTPYDLSLFTHDHIHYAIQNINGEIRALSERKFLEEDILKMLDRQ